MHKFLTASLIAFAVSMPAYAQHPETKGATPARIVEMKDGSTLHI